MSLSAADGPAIVTERFELWKPQASDLDDMIRLIADEETRRYLGPAQPEAKGVFERLQRNGGSWALYGYGTFAVRQHGRGEIIANCGVFHTWRGFGKGMDDMPEAGWIVRKDHWGQGLAKEVMQAALAWFDAAHGPRRIACMIEEGNRASERVAAALGFTACGSHDIGEDGHAVIVNLFERGAD
ncbi:GNAT family N-acetyltransferase [Novosphingobium sp.]|uniref:GNAT family N-acetyltransferase n=1 Tax=Novosphingobium sp. TaxID=1874826 RepID=UPI0028B10D01|nr:GNAT family N-acetyltransferase [Novosphingobium sp.]